MNDTRPAAFRPEIAKQAWARTLALPAAQQLAAVARCDAVQTGPRQDQRQRALAGREAGDGAVDGDRRAARVAQREREAPRLGALGHRLEGRRPVRLRGGLDEGAAPRRRAARRARRRAGRRRRGSRRRARPESASIARKASQTRSMAATTARRLPRGAPRARRALPVERSALRKRSSSGASASLTAAPRSPATSAAACDQAASSASTRRSFARRPSRAGSAALPRCSAEAANERKRRSTSASAAPGSGACGAELVRHHLLDLLPLRDEPGGERGVCRHAGSLTARSPAAINWIARRCR